MGARSAGNPHAACDVEGTGNVARSSGLPARQSSTLPRRMSNARCGIFWAQVLGARRFVTTVGRDEKVIRAYIKNQELADQQLEQFELKI